MLALSVSNDCQSEQSTTAGGDPKSSSAKIYKPKTSRTDFTRALKNQNAQCSGLHDILRLRTSAIHERAKALQVLLRHTEAVEDFTDLLATRHAPLQHFFGVDCLFERFGAIHLRLMTRNRPRYATS